MKTWMDISSFFGTTTSSSVSISSTHTEKGSNCSDSDSDISEPPSKMACKRVDSAFHNEEKILKNWENELAG